MTPPLPDRIAAAIDEFRQSVEEDYSDGLGGSPSVGTQRIRARLNAAIAEVVAERDAQRADAVRCSDEIYRVLLAIVPEAKGNLGQLAEAVRVKCDAATKRADGLAEELDAVREELRAHIDARTDLVQEGIVKCGEPMSDAVIRLRTDLAAAQAKLATLLAATKEAEEVLALMERPRIEDPSYGSEVRALGDRIGFGALMSSASASWRKRLEGSGGPVGGEHCAGPCHATVLMTLKVARDAIAAAEQGGAP